MSEQKIVITIFIDDDSNIINQLNLSCEPALPKLFEDIKPIHRIASNLRIKLIEFLSEEEVPE